MTKTTLDTGLQTLSGNCLKDNITFNLHTKHNNIEKALLRQIKQKLDTHHATITRANKGNALVIIYQQDYDSKVQTFINTSSFSILRTDPTKKFQRDLRKDINLCQTVIPQNIRWKFINLNPTPPRIQGVIKVHKIDAPIRPVINWQNAPTYRLSQHFSTIINTHIPLPYTFNVKNSVHLMEDLLQIPYNEHLRFAPFDISDMYSNIPTEKIP
jgi:hypothetical protein